MTTNEVIQDLQAIKEYFEQESGGAYPICLERAIELLKKGERDERDTCKNKWRSH